MIEACRREHPDHIFYLSITAYDYRAEPYVRIPFRLQRSVDLLPEVLPDG